MCVCEINIIIPIFFILLLQKYVCTCASVVCALYVCVCVCAFVHVCVCVCVRVLWPVWVMSAVCCSALICPS